MERNWFVQFEPAQVSPFNSISLESEWTERDIFTSLALIGNKLFTKSQSRDMKIPPFGVSYCLTTINPTNPTSLS
uniref:Uncharacterized protein n=1 Tax=Rhizophagus irregularis (strain DAOM 181602 / DAOM 197198 / MUCL 43194) TaxID=747089 RepID=U9TVF2_RHIID